MVDDKRLIEDYLPIQAISAEASREKSVRKGHISTLHLWWARRPLVDCRVTVYGTLVPADQWVKDVELRNPPEDAASGERMVNGAKKGLNRMQPKRFVSDLCTYPGSPRTIAEAQPPAGGLGQTDRRRTVGYGHPGPLPAPRGDW